MTEFSLGFHEDDALRSEFIRRLLMDERAEATTESETGCSIPRVLVRYWHDADAVPTDVAECLRSWEPLRQAGFEILTFDDRLATKYIAETFGPLEVEAFRRCRHPAMRSDYLRLCYIYSAGGFYVDADDALTEGAWWILFQDDRLKLQPLCYDLSTQSMTSTTQLWNSRKPEPERIFYVNNNPLVAPAGHPVIRLALNRATSLLMNMAVEGEIQSTTGPGNLTISLARHAYDLGLADLPPDFQLLRKWDRIAQTRWDLSYRADWRNWRNMSRS